MKPALSISLSVFHLRVTLLFPGIASKDASSMTVGGTVVEVVEVGGTVVDVVEVVGRAVVVVAGTVVVTGTKIPS